MTNTEIKGWQVLLAWIAFFTATWQVLVHMTPFVGVPIIGTLFVFTWGFSELYSRQK